MKWQLFLGLVTGHMEMTFPRIPKSRYDNIPWYEKDYENVFPIGNRFALVKPFCHYNMDEVSPIDTFSAGETIHTKFAGDAPHDGGHCEFSLSYDNRNFAVIETIIENCLANGVRSYPIFIPKEAPSGTVVLSWVWFNRRGEREIYNNCAKITIKGRRSGSIVGPKLLIANLPGYPTIHQFIYSVKGVHLFRNRPAVRTGLDQQGKAYSVEINTQKYKKLPGLSYFYDPFHPSIDPTRGYPNYGKNENVDD